MLNLYNRIERICQERRITVTDMCRESGANRASLSDLNVGRKKSLSSATLVKISQYFNVTVDYLLGNDPQAQYDDATYEIEKYRRIYDMETDPDARSGLMQIIRMLEDERDDTELRAAIERKLEKETTQRQPTDDVEHIAYMAPVLGRIPAGYPVYAVEDELGRDPVPEGIPHPEECFYLEVSGDSMIGAGIYPGDRVLIRHQSDAENGQIVACRVNGDEATLKRFHKQGDQVMLTPENAAYSPIIVPASQFETGDAAILGVAITVTHRL